MIDFWRGVSSALSALVSVLDFLAARQNLITVWLLCLIVIVLVVGILALCLGEEE